MEEYKEIERSIIKKYRKEIWAKFVKACKEYELINEGDKVMVCISGGKDSFLLAKCVEELQKHGGVKFDAFYVCMNPGYNDANKEMILNNAKKLNINLEMFDSDIFDVANMLNEKSPCYMCARMRRGYLYNKAKELGCNKIALGHHFDDVIETILMGMLYGAQVQTMMPKLHSKNFEGMELIRPLYMVKEADIIAWKEYHDLQFIQCACRFTENCTMCDNGGGGSKRQEIKMLIKKLRTIHPNVDISIFRSVENVNLDTIISYHRGKDVHHFLDTYHQEKESSL